MFYVLAVDWVRETAYAAMLTAEMDEQPTARDERVWDERAALAAAVARPAPAMPADAGARAEQIRSFAEAVGSPGAVR